MKYLKYIGLTVLTLVLSAVIGVVITQRVSDGPIEFLQGGPFKTGEVVEEPVTDWSFAAGKTSEFELEAFGTSRTAGYILHEGVPYMTCDLGFIWNRLNGRSKTILNMIYLFKTWHLDAVVDGRALLRIDGKIYPTQFTKVEDPKLNAALRVELENLAREHFAPRELGPAPTEAPNDIWFFRIDSRT